MLLAMTGKSGSYMLLTSFSLAYILRYCAQRFAKSTIKFKLWRYTASFCTALFLQFTLWPLFAYVAGHEWSYYDTKLIITFISESLLLATLIMLLQDFAILRYGKSQTELENSTLQMRTTEAENLLLKQQIHPHFLFNSLNTLKALYKKDTSLGENYLIRLADFLRSAVSHNNSLATTLEEELHFCENYLTMQKIRFGNALEWTIKIQDTAMLKGFVPSFSLQPLAENAIKHNRFTIQNPLIIVIEQQGEHISVCNPVNSGRSGETSIKSGLGNLAERYQLWCNDDIVIKNDGATFSVSFKIRKDENSNY